jgi:hypothetical protein
VTIDVAKATPAITWPTPAGITYGTALSATQLNAHVAGRGHVRLHAGAGRGPERGHGADAVGDLHADDAANYTTATATVTIRCREGDADDHLAAPAGITYGTALSATQLNCHVAGRRHVRLHAGAGAVLNAGSADAVGDVHADDAANYTTATATVTIDVAKATPAITWPAPAGITYGTALSATQLNATSPVAGTFVYTPALGAVLNAGHGRRCR